MDVKTIILYFKKIKHFLVFFVLLINFNCSRNIEVKNVEVVYQNDKAIKILFNSVGKLDDISIYLIDQNTPVLGEFDIKQGYFEFTPVIPFTNNQEYIIEYDDHRKASFKIKETKWLQPPEVIAVFPSTDSVPENLLKMYISFSQPMERVHKSKDFISITDLNSQEEVEIFLELDPELWNKEQTRLTLWLDPGRIKTGLIPNKNLGLPILSGRSYLIEINKNWKNAQGIAMNQNFKKTIVVHSKDSTMPSLKSWNIGSVKKGTNNTLVIDFKEAMDAILSLETIKIINENNEIIMGKYQLENDERHLLFSPIHNWKKGNYTILVKSKLEDLAGNNFNRLFDIDLQNDATINKNTEAKSRSFYIY